MRTSIYVCILLLLLLLLRLLLLLLLLLLQQLLILLLIIITIIIIILTQHNNHDNNRRYSGGTGFPPLFRVKSLAGDQMGSILNNSDRFLTETMISDKNGFWHKWCRCKHNDFWHKWCRCKNYDFWQIGETGTRAQNCQMLTDAARVKSLGSAHKFHLY